MKKLINVDKTYNEMRIDRFLRNHLGQIPQSFIEKNLRNGKIKLNKKKIKSSTKVKINDQVELYNIKFDQNFNQIKEKFLPSNQVIKENEDLIIEDNNDFVVLNKQPGISVQGGTKSKKNLIDIFSKSEIFKETKPFSVHRLDKDTSGVFVIAKNRETAQLLTTLFRLRKVYKTYVAICVGEISVKEKGILTDNLVRYENKKKIIEKAETRYEILDRNNNATFIELNPITGRKHQLRKQLYNIGNPIVGDNKYFINRKVNKKKVKSKNLMLHAYKIKFMINNIQYNFKAKYNKDFEEFLKKQF